MNELRAKLYGPGCQSFNLHSPQGSLLGQATAVNKVALAEGRELLEHGCGTPRELDQFLQP